MPGFPCVTLLGVTGTSFGRDIVGGIGAYCRESRTDWLFCLTSVVTRASIAKAAKDFHGIIAAVNAQPLVRSLAACRVPCVNVYPTTSERLPTVRCDERAVGRLGAEYLLSRGFRKLAFCRSRFGHASTLRQESFCQRVQQAALERFVHRPGTVPSGRGKLVNQKLLGTGMAGWLHQLPRPVGLMAANDSLGHHVLEVCRGLAIRVPDEIAVLGVGNDRALCQFSTPPLSSIALPGRAIGHQAAALLARLLSGQRPPNHPILIPPLGVVERKSTNVFASKDPQVAQALRFIEEHACDPIQVEDVSSHVRVSRRVLERRFHDLLGMTPHHAIRQVQLARVKRLLVETGLSLSQIARAAGFVDAKSFYEAFRKAVGSSPRSYRRSCCRPAVTRLS